MAIQTSLFTDLAASTEVTPLPGFRYRPDLIDAEEEAALAAEVACLPFRPFEFQGFLANRRVASFGFSYDYGRQRLARAPDLPSFLAALRAKVADFAGLAPESFRQVLITEYTPGAGIGWHRDKKQYGEVWASRFCRRRPSGCAGARASAGAGSPMSSSRDRPITWPAKPGMSGSTAFPSIAGSATP